MLTDNFQLSPANAKARWERLQAVRRHFPHADDPLFRPIDANDFRTNGNNASDFTNLIEHGLIRVSIPLPPNVKLIDPATNLPSSETVADVWRSVPSVNNVKITGPDGQLPAAPRGPNPSGGYQLDARKTTLQEQALGAFIDHAQITATPQQRMLDDLAEFQNRLFSSNGVRRLANAMEAGQSPLPDPDPVLTPLEQQGKAVFIRACGQCHGNDGNSPTTGTPINITFATTTPPSIVRYHNILTSCPRNPNPIGNFKPCAPTLNATARIYEVTSPPPPGSPPGTPNVVQRFNTSEPGRMLLTGHPADNGQLDVPQLRGISKTAPYFSNNSAATLEEMLDHYDAFFRFVGQVANPRAPILTTDGINQDRPPRPEERPALLAYLRKL